jgi:hypothetical protein
MPVASIFAINLKLKGKYMYMINHPAKANPPSNPQIFDHLLSLPHIHTQKWGACADVTDQTFCKFKGRVIINNEIIQYKF